MTSILTLPTLIGLAFAGGAGAQKGLVNAIPVASASPNASYADGFPILTMTNPTAGGVPPAGADFNGILNSITTFQCWANAGGQYPFNASLAATIGGYPLGAVLQLNGGLGCVVSTVNGNTQDPNAAMTGWLPYGGAFPAGQVLVGNGTGTVSSTGLTFSATAGLATTTASTVSANGSISTTTVTPVSALSVSFAAVSGTSILAGGYGSTASIYGANFLATNAATAGTVASVIGAQVGASHSGAGTSNILQGINVFAGKSAGTVTSATGIYVNAITAGSVGNYAIQTNAGIVALGDTTACTGPLTGSLRVAGGAAIAGALNVGGGSVPMSTYNEGTWTPSATALGGSGVSYTTKWTQVGNLITFCLNITGTALTSTGGTTFISLPFTPARYTACSTVYTSTPQTVQDAPLALTNGQLQLPTLTSTGQIYISGTFSLT
jgi:hypothetical protein